ncbi:hypothetical protein ACHAW6_006857 [Cyclotella cf. meneghiniana]
MLPRPQMYSIHLEYPYCKSNKNMTSRSQAIEIAVDAHATRLIQNNSPPEACVDSSLGPYVTSILRRALTSHGNIMSSMSLSALSEYDSLIELLESQCQMASKVAKQVISDIALAVETNGVPNCHGHHDSSGGATEQFVADTRSRSKSLGAEPALDVHFLGKILQETMTQQTSSLSSFEDFDFGSKLGSTPDRDFAPPQSRTDEDFYPSNDTFVLSAKKTIVNSSTATQKGRQIQKQRHVSFDETHATAFKCGPQCREAHKYDIALSSSSSWYSFSSPNSGVGMDDEQACLGASLGFLDLEDEDNDCVAGSQLAIENMQSSGTPVHTGNSFAENQWNESKNQRASLDVINSEMAQCHPVSGFPDIVAADNDDLHDYANAISDKPRPNPKRSSRKQSSKKEAEDLAAALFSSTARPRSNSLPLSVSAGVSSFSCNDKAAVRSSSISLCNSVTSATTNNTENNSAIIESTIEILLTMNYNLGHEAASLASLLTNGDLNLAQYLIEAARSITTGGFGFNNYHQRRKSRICRHELQGTCYRADCPYSHDIAGVTCLFWLKGRCHHSDGSSCRFMHGFAESLLEGVNEDYLKEQQMKKEREEQERLVQVKLEEEKRNQAVFVPTTNLLQHNKWASEKNQTSVSPIFGSSCWTSPSLMNR